MGVPHTLRRGWIENRHRMEFEPVRGCTGSVAKEIHPTTFRLLFHALAWNALQLEPLLDLWTTDRREAVMAVEDAFK